LRESSNRQRCTSVDTGVNANLKFVDKFCYFGDVLSAVGDTAVAYKTVVSSTAYMISRAIGRGIGNFVRYSHPLEYTFTPPPCRPTNSIKALKALTQTHTSDRIAVDLVVL